MAKFAGSCLLIFGILIGFAQSSLAREFYVGGRDGWVLNPSENYNQWAARMRFQINDTLLFKYKKGEDSVLVVNKQQFDTCNTSDPIAKLDDGNSVFKFDRSGAFFFVSGTPEKCGKGQKLHLIVMAVRNKNNSRSSPTTPSTTAGAPAPSVSSTETSPVPAPSNSSSTSPPPSKSAAVASSSPMAYRVVLGTATAALMSFALFQ